MTTVYLARNVPHTHSKCYLWKSHAFSYFDICYGRDWAFVLVVWSAQLLYWIAQTLHRYRKTNLNFGLIALIDLYSTKVPVHLLNFIYIVQYCTADMQKLLVKVAQIHVTRWPSVSARWPRVETIDVYEDLLHRLELFSVSSCSPEIFYIYAICPAATNK